MFYNYEIKNNGKEDILYLYLSMEYEFSKELSSHNDNDLGRRTKNFIRTNQINFQGKRVYLIVDGIVVKSLDLSLANEDINDNQSFSCDSYMVHILLEDQSLCEISLRDYLLSILLYSYSPDIHEEVLKAMTILFTTYAYKMMKENNFIVSTNRFNHYQPISYYRDNVNGYDEIIIKLNNIIDSVNCMFLKYHDDYILPFIHYSNSGKTLENKNYPYLSSVKSLWDMTSPYYVQVEDFSFIDIEEKFSISLTADSPISIGIKDGIKKVQLGDAIYTMEEFKNTLDLKSSEVTIIVYQHFLRIITSGFGNEYGLSIFGANEIAKNGGKFFNILNYYFPKTSLFRYVEQ